MTFGTMIVPGKFIQFKYVNYKGVEATRVCKVYGFMFGSNEYHKEEQMLLIGMDLEKEATRSYAVKDMREVRVFQGDVTKNGTI
jgi:hypothetical protein